VAVIPSLDGENTWPGFQDDLVAWTEGMHACPLSADDERRLARAATAGDRRASACLVEANLRLVVSVARRYADRGVPFLDLVQEGGAGLMDAVDSYDPTRGCPFSAYAERRVCEAVRRAAVDRGGLVRFPAATAGAIERLRGAAGRLALLLGREPTDEELALELDTTARRVARLVRLSRPPLALQDLDGRPRVVEEWADSPSEGTVLAALRVDLHAMLATLTARERRVLHLRLGLADGRRCPPGEVAKRLGLSPERVRQVERLAMAKLRQATTFARPV
jgi:RNA polymerase primary sigma factor